MGYSGPFASPDEKGVQGQNGAEKKAKLGCGPRTGPPSAWLHGALEHGSHKRSEFS